MGEVQQVKFNNAGCNQGNIGDEDCLSVSIYTPYVIYRNSDSKFTKSHFNSKFYQFFQWANSCQQQETPRTNFYQ